MGLYEITTNKRKVTMFSYPRSGSNWVSYCIENICGLKVIGSDNNIGGVDVEKRLELDPSAIIHKSHGGKYDWDLFFGNNENNNSEGLLFIIRNYKESILNHQGHNKPKYSTCTYHDGGKIVHPLEDMKLCLIGSDNKTDSADYLRMVQKYDLYKGYKLMVDYDDFILNTRKELEKIMAWLINFGVDYNINKIENFMNNIEGHKSASIKTYIGRHGKTATDGDPKKLKIQKETWLTDVIEKEIDEYVEKQDPLIYEKYLKRYKL